MAILRGGVLIDGTGALARPADVQFDGGRITAVDAPGALTGDDVIDVDGRVIAPGFIDIHTHYDAQVLWDPDLTPSCWHGVTSVIMGNCGFGIAPTNPAHRDVIVRTLENVEGMSAEALSAGINWSFESFPEYLDLVERTQPRLNVAVMLGHTPLRLSVMGPEAVERAATDDEIAEMRRVAGEALDAGAFGLASSRTPAHAGAWGKPVPSRLAEMAELEAIVGTLGVRPGGMVAVSGGPDLGVDEMAHLAELAGCPVTSPIMSSLNGPDPIDALDRATKLGGNVWRQVACRPVVFQVTLMDPAPFARIPAFAEVLSVESAERARFYGDREWRARANEESVAHWNGLWSRVFVQETEVHHELTDGQSLAELAEARGTTPVDMLCDLALAEDLRTRFRVVIANDNEDGIARLLRDDRSVIGLSDAGAHASQICDAVFSTHLLGYWVRERQALPLEKAVWKLTGQPADVFGVADRGRIAPGNAADIVVFDPDTVGVGPMERVWDLPAGADRLLAPSTGIFGVWVNGERIVDGDGLTDARPGVLLRRGR